MVPPRVSNLHDDCNARNNDAVKCLPQIYVCKPKREIPFQRPAANIFLYHKSIFYISAWSESNLIFGLMLLQCWPRSLPNQCQYKNSPNAWKPTSTTALRNYIARKTQLMLKTVWLQLASIATNCKHTDWTHPGDICASPSCHRIKHSATKPLVSAHLFRLISFKTTCNSKIVKGSTSGKPLADVFFQ